MHKQLDKEKKRQAELRVTATALAICRLLHIAIVEGLSSPFISRSGQQCPATQCGRRLQTATGPAFILDAVPAFVVASHETPSALSACINTRCRRWPRTVHYRQSQQPTPNTHLPIVQPCRLIDRTPHMKSTGQAQGFPTWTDTRMCYRKRREHALDHFLRRAGRR